MTWAPHVTVAAVIEQSGRFLFVEEHTDEGLRINQPAGHLEENESLIQACAREALEETGHRVQVQFLLGAYQWKRPVGDITYLRFAFGCASLSVESERALDQGIVRALWLTPLELEQAAQQGRLRSPLVWQCVQDYLAGKRFELDFIRHFN